MGWLLGVITIVGFVIAIGQLIQVGRVASATHKAMGDVSRRTGNYNILLIVPRLIDLDRECETAISRDDRTSTLKMLTEWRNLVAEMRGFLEGDVSVDPKVLTALQASLTTSTTAKRALLNTTTPIDVATRGVRLAMGKACEEVASMSAKMRVYVDPLPPPATLSDLWGKARARVFTSGKKVAP